MEDETLDIHRAVHRLGIPYCLVCGLDVEDQGVTSMSGPGRSLWVHIETGLPTCRPGDKNSPRAVPIRPQETIK